MSQPPPHGPVGPYGQQPSQPPAWNQPPPQQPMPPKTSSLRVVLGIGGGALALVVAILLIGGFVWPGWFRSSQIFGTSADDLSARLVAAINHRDSASLNGLLCSPASPDSTKTVQQLLSNQATATVDGVPQPDPSGALGKLDATFGDGSKHQYITGLAHDTHGWCVAAIDESGN